MRGAVYNSRILFFHFAARILLGILVLCYGAAARADDLDSLANKFAEKIVSVTGPGALSVEVTNHSSLTKSEVAGVQRGLLTALAGFGGRAVNAGQAAASIKVSLSEDLRNYVWIAEIKMAANDSSVAIISAPRLKFNVSPLEGAALSIRKSLLWSSEEQILDAAEIAGRNLLVLYPEQVTLYKSQGGKFQAEQSLPIPHSQPWPRDLRGRLVPRKDYLFDAYLPGIFCRSTGSATAGLSCKQSDDPWPIGSAQFPLSGFFTPARNYFTGALSPGVGKQRAVASFYSAALNPGDALWLFAGVDGNVHLTDGVNEQIANLGWGSDIADLTSNCGSGSQILVSGIDDSVRAFEMNRREPVPATQAISLDGAVTAMWAAADGGSVIAVSHNRGTGAYEAYRLTVTCGQ
jgi:hypothetical protein